MEKIDGKINLLRNMMIILEDHNITQESINSFKELIFSNCEAALEVQKQKDVESRMVTRRVLWTPARWQFALCCFFFSRCLFSRWLLLGRCILGWSFFSWGLFSYFFSSWLFRFSLLFRLCRRRNSLRVI